jgi:hypothetical protein
MKAKVIYVDFTSKAKKVTHPENSINRSFIGRLFDKIRKLFRSPEEPLRQVQDSYFFKRMM